MLTITVNDDKSITVTSDDDNAENVYVAEALDNAGYPDIARAWDKAEVNDDGVLEVTYGPGDDVLRFLGAIEVDENLGHASEQIEAAIDAVSPPHVGGGPKPTR